MRVWRPFTTATPASELALLVAIVLGAFALRVVPWWSTVFGQEYVAFIESDAWYHMRLVDALIRDFPHRIWHDPYLVHPGGEAVNAGPMLDWIIAGLALLLGGGSPSARLVDVVGAFVPPVVGALTVVPVYVIGRQIFGPGAGLWAGLLAAVMPGQILRRSALGFTDHHCLEVLLTTTTVMCVALAVADGRSLRSRRVCSLLGGFSLGAYCLTWGGAVLLIAVLSAWAGFELVRSMAGGRVADTVVPVVGVVLVVAACMVLPWALTRPQFGYQVASALGAAAFLATAYGAQALARRRAWGALAGVIVVVAVAAVGTAAVLLSGEALEGLVGDLRRVSPFRSPGFILEAQPLLASELRYPIPLWKEFTVATILATLGAALLTAPPGPNTFRGAYALLTIWTAVNLLATFGQIRFTHYLGVNVALLAGFVCSRTLDRIGSWIGGGRPRRAAAVAMALAVSLPGMPVLYDTIGRTTPLGLGWHDALRWLASNTPEPFAGPDAYYRPRLARDVGAGYGVLALWDYGYWITRVARRVPVSNPRQTNVAGTTAFLLSSSEVEANQVADRLGVGYVLVDWHLQARSVVGKDGTFSGLALAAGRNPFDYCGLFVDERDPVDTAPALYCYPRYFQTTAMRLYLYGGRAAAPENGVRVVKAQREVSGRLAVNVVTARWTFPTYDEAVRFVEASGEPGLRVVSENLKTTCVPLEAYTSYTPVFRSMEREGLTLSDRPLVQIFQYRGNSSRPPA